MTCPCGHNEWFTDPCLRDGEQACKRCGYIRLSSIRPFDPSIASDVWSLATKLFTPAELIELQAAQVGGDALSINDIRDVLGLEPIESAEAVDASDLRGALTSDRRPVGNRIYLDEVSDWGDVHFADFEPGGRLNGKRFRELFLNQPVREFTAGLINPDGSREYIDVTSYPGPTQWYDDQAQPLGQAAAMSCDVPPPRKCSCGKCDTCLGPAVRDELGAASPVTPTTPGRITHAVDDGPAIKRRMADLGLTGGIPIPDAKDARGKPPTYADYDAPDFNLWGQLQVYSGDKKIEQCVAYDTIKGWYEVIDLAASRVSGTKARVRFNGIVTVRWRDEAAAPTTGGPVGATQLERDVANFRRFRSGTSYCFETCLVCGTRPVCAGNTFLCEVGDCNRITSVERARYDAARDYVKHHGIIPPVRDR